MDNEVIIPKISKKFEKIDRNIFKKNASIHEEKFENKYVKYTSANIGFGKVTYFNDSFFKIVKSFYSNNNDGIRKKGVMFINGSQYGIWYEFNEKGDLINEINTDAGYDFTWEQIIEYCNKNNIILEKGQPRRGGVQTEIYKKEEENIKVWTISYYNNKAEQYLEVTLDGKTGEELKKRELSLDGY